MKLLMLLLHQSPPHHLLLLPLADTTMTSTTNRLIPPPTVTKNSHSTLTRLSPLMQASRTPSLPPLPMNLKILRMMMSPLKRSFSARVSIWPDVFLQTPHAASLTGTRMTTSPGASWQKPPFLNFRKTNPTSQLLPMTHQRPPHHLHTQRNTSLLTRPTPLPPLRVQLGRFLKPPATSPQSQSNSRSCLSRETSNNKTTTTTLSAPAPT